MCFLPFFGVERKQKRSDPAPKLSLFYNNVIGNGIARMFFVCSKHYTAKFHSCKEAEDK